jgi:hypothetical protein
LSATIALNCRLTSPCFASFLESFTQCQFLPCFHPVSQDRDAKVSAVSELIEKNLRLLGCTAIEDKLQVCRGDTAGESSCTGYVCRAMVATLPSQ